MTEKEMEKLVEETIAKHLSVTDEFKRYCQDAYPTDGYTFDDKEFENVRPVLSMFKEWLDNKMMENAIEAEVSSAGMFAPLINVKDKEKVKDFCFGDSVKILIFKKD